MAQKKKQAAYIAGKITGKDDYWDAFEVAQDKLEDLGYAVLNPAQLPEGMTKADYARICFSMIDSADIVFFLSDYKDSPGAMLELAYCEYTGKPATFLEV